MSTFECNNPDFKNTIQPQSSSALDNNRLIVLRYGKEELIALYQSDLNVPDELNEFTNILSKHELKPFSLKPASESEQHNLHQALCGSSRSNPNYKQNIQRPYSRTIINSSKNFSRNANPQTCHQVYNKFNEAPMYADHNPSEDTSFEPSSLPDQSTVDNSNFYRHPRSRDYFPSFQISRSNNSHQQFKKGSSIISGSWRNSARSIHSKSLNDEISVTSTLPEWLDEEPTDYNPKNMTFDNQGKFVHVDSLEEPSDDLHVTNDNFVDQLLDTSCPVQHPKNDHTDPILSNDPNNEIAYDLTSLSKHIDLIKDAKSDCPTTLINGSKSNLLGNPLRWYYIDPQNTIQGPFSDNQMSKWYSAGYFSSSILIRRTTDLNFSQLGEYVNALGPGFFHSHQPYRGFSEYIDNSTFNTAVQENALFMNDWNSFVNNHLACDDEIIKQANQLKDSLGNTIGKSSSHNEHILIDADSNEITKRLGFSDPSVMAISTNQQNYEGEQVHEEPWQQIMKRAPQKNRAKQPAVKVVNKTDDLPIGLTIQSQPMSMASSNSNLSTAIDNYAFSLAARNENLYDLIIDDKAKFIKANDRRNERSPHWTYNHIVTNSTTNFRDILMEEEERSKKEQIERALAAQMCINRPPVTHTGWKIREHAPIESFNQIQLEEMRRNQSSQVDSVNRNFKPETLNLLRHLQQPNDCKMNKNLSNWSQWNSSSENIWKQEISSLKSSNDGPKQTDGKACVSMNGVEHSLLSWAKSEITSMYGPKVHGDAVIHLLCKFNTALEMESFIRQSLGTHTKAAQFAVNFHSKLIASEKSRYQNDDDDVNNISPSEVTANSGENTLDSSLSTDQSINSTVSISSKRNKKKSKRTHKQSF